MDDLNAAIKEIQACPPARALQHHECVQQKRAKQNEARECRKLLQTLSEGAREEGEEKEQKDRVKGGEKGRVEGKKKGKKEVEKDGREKEGTLTRAGIVQLVSPTWHDETITSIYKCEVRIYTIIHGHTHRHSPRMLQVRKPHINIPPASIYSTKAIPFCDPPCVSVSKICSIDATIHSYILYNLNYDLLKMSSIIIFNAAF